jgi:AAA15 family ATPase/GTPase
MIKNIEIDNFRCFNKTKVDGFSRINLFGGKNNSGKTALLESVLLGLSPKIVSVENLRRLRKIAIGFQKELPERAWDHLFLDTKAASNIRLNSDNGDLFDLSMFVDQSVKDFEEYAKSKSNENEDEDETDIKEVVSSQDSIRSTLHLKYKVNGNVFNNTGLAYKKGILINNVNIPDIKIVNLIPANAKASNTSLVQEYDKAFLNGLREEILKGLQVIDADIDDVQSIYSGSPMLFIRTKKRGFLPIGLYGDAINKVADFLLKIINNRDSILLIDEIENGIHYSNQEYLWEKLFQLSELFNVQIFTTTHSLEMIKAFERVISREQFSNDGTYFELLRHIKTNEIVANRRDHNSLEYEIENNFPLRGE